MMKSNARTYPVGVQSFKILRESGFVYVDKTQYISRLLDDNSRYVFLSRPRRFGKSLLTSTFHEFFAGNRELFEGLYIADVEKEWTEYPVLHFDMSFVKSDDVKLVERNIDGQLRIHEKVYGRDEQDIDPNMRLHGLIRRAYEQTGRGVVLLIDEYDAPMMEVLTEEETLHQVRRVMRDFFSPIKACDPYLRFVFLTGITKFSQMSIFSELNNLRNISMVPEFAGICGITKTELDTVLAPDIDLFAQRRGESREEVREQLRRRYDGYHFAWPSEDIFNPYSLLNVFNDKMYDDYWFGTATPKFLIDLLRKCPAGMVSLSGQWVDKSSFNVAAERPSDLLPLLYQTGYLTIKDYRRSEDDEDDGEYLLEMPNKEVRKGMSKNLLKGYVANEMDSNRNIKAMRMALRNDDLDGMLDALRSYLATKPYLEQTVQNEAYYQDMLFVIFTLLGCSVGMEVRGSMGRIDMVLYRPGRIYVMELKINSTPEEALRQIDDRRYAARFSGRQERIVKVGVSFSTAERNISGWIVADDSLGEHPSA